MDIISGGLSRIGVSKCEELLAPLAPVIVTSISKSPLSILSEVNKGSIATPVSKFNGNVYALWPGHLIVTSPYTLSTESSGSKTRISRFSSPPASTFSTVSPEESIIDISIIGDWSEIKIVLRVKNSPSESLNSKVNESRLVEVATAKEEM